jgi:hypothetical protein
MQMQSSALCALVFILLMGYNLADDCTRTQLTIDPAFEPSDAVWDNIRQVVIIFIINNNIFI